MQIILCFSEPFLYSFLTENMGFFTLCVLNEQTGYLFWKQEGIFCKDAVGPRTSKASESVRATLAWSTITTPSERLYTVHVSLYQATS